jgi:hypothetical protein
MNEMLDAQDSLYDAAFVSAEEYYEEMQPGDLN